MLTWALANLCLTLLALGFAACATQTPYRLRFLGCCVALAAWLVPWHLLASPLPDWLALGRWQRERSHQVFAATLQYLPVYVIETGTGGVRARLLPPATLLVWVLALTGALRLGWVLLAQRRLLARLAARGAVVEAARLPLVVTVPVLRQDEIPGAFTSGLLRPRLWLHHTLLGSPQLGTVLRHELTHLRQHDNWYLLVITGVECLLWWNPLARYLGREARRLQELSCDAACQRQDARYQADLAALILQAAVAPLGPAPLPLSANIRSLSHLNVQRLQLLERSLVMQTRHKLTAVAILCGGVAAIGLVTAQPAPPEGAGDVLFISRGGAPGTPSDTAVFGMRGATVAGDQFMQVQRNGDATHITFAFTDATLPFVLAPLANLLNAPSLPYAGQAAAAAPLPPRNAAPPAPPANAIPPANPASPASAASEAGSVRQLQTFHVVREAGQTQEKHIFTTLRRGVAPEGDVAVAGFNAEAAAPGLLPEARLMFEDDSYRERTVSISGEADDIDEALDLIADASGCPIYRDGSSIVIDYCEP